MLEFPKRTRIAPPVEAPVSIPAWRAELNEKVRAIRARRSTDSQAPGAEQPESSFDIERLTEAAVQHPTEPAASYGANVSLRNPALRNTVERTSMPADSARRASSTIVEAALNRVKRASENASRAALPKIEPARTMPASSQAGLAIDRQATARALEPAPEIESNPEPAPSPRPELVQSQFTRPARVETVLPVKETARAIVIPDPEPQPSFIADTPKQISTLVIDELEPLDYLEAEVRKVDQALGAEFLRNESPSILTHAVISCVDAIAIAASCSPFLAIIRISDGNFASTQTRFTSGAVVALIAFFYLALTQSLCGRTFGMMFTNTRIVDSLTFESPSASRALLRTVGYFIAAVPAFAGIAWAAFNRKRRGWQDFISGTVVVRDF
ncbi:MAG TPA: RDD family protein [Blastocatellia bacterium]|nr:RDD family protein [Blastocatellia bacterium]